MKPKLMNRIYCVLAALLFVALALPMTATPAYACENTISGRVTSRYRGSDSVTGVADVLITLDAEIDRTALTDADGYYSITDVSCGTTGTLTPALFGYAFQPAFRSVENLSGDLTGQDFDALRNTISGQVSGVALGTTVTVIATDNMSPDPKPTYSTTFVMTSDPMDYVITDLNPMVDYRVTAQAEGYTFDTLYAIPPGAKYVNFQGTPVSITLSGHVEVQGRNVANVTVTAAGLSTTTDKSGNYSLTLPYGTEAIVPTASHPYFTFADGEAFVPNANTVANWTEATVVVTGRVRARGTGLEGVNVRAGMQTALTDAEGYYTLTVSAGDVFNQWAFLVAAHQDGYRLMPPLRMVSPRSGNENKNFTAWPVRR